MSFWIVLLVCVEKILQIKAKNVGIALVMSRLFNAEMYNFCSKKEDKLNRHWYTMPILQNIMIL